MTDDKMRNICPALGLWVQQQLSGQPSANFPKEQLTRILKEGKIGENSWRFGHSVIIDDENLCIEVNLSVK